MEWTTNAGYRSLTDSFSHGSHCPRQANASGKVASHPMLPTIAANIASAITSEAGRGIRLLDDRRARARRNSAQPRGRLRVGGRRVGGGPYLRIGAARKRAEHQRITVAWRAMNLQRPFSICHMSVNRRFWV
jgi:hypothetical protein